jgi:hypothetical protein
VATSTSLNLRAVLKAAVTRSGMDVSARSVSGLTASAKALFVASAAHAQPKGVVLYIVPGDGDLEETCADVAFFLAALEGLAPAVVERAVLPFPSHEVDPYRGLAPHIGVTSVRARALYAIAQGAARVVIASAAGVLPRVTAADQMLAASLTLKPGQDISPVDLAELLASRVKTRPTKRGNSPSAAASPTSFPPANRTRYGWSSSGTRSRRSAPTIPRRSDRLRQSIRLPSFPFAMSCRTIAMPRSSTT